MEEDGDLRDKGNRQTLSTHIGSNKRLNTNGNPLPTTGNRKDEDEKRPTERINGQDHREHQERKASGNEQ